MIPNGEESVRCKVSSEIEFELEEDTLSDAALVGLVGEVDEEATQAVLSNLIELYGGRLFPLICPDDVPAIEFIISTSGGAVQDMFAIYDLMRLIRPAREIHTYGVGKVMSAGVLLLAAGTKGQRRIGKHCRIMLHHVMSSEAGPLPNLQSTFKEAHVMEKMMFEAIAAETNLSVKELRRICEKNVDKFFTAEEALKMGIVDIIV
jgi:ATP-dependent Clp protease protease subunit